MTEVIEMYSGTVDRWDYEGFSLVIFYDREEDVDKLYHYFAPQGSNMYRWAKEISPYDRKRSTFQDFIDRRQAEND